MTEPHQFQTTHWTQVIAARGDSPEARLALRELCETYYEPVAMFVERSRGHFPLSPDNARDLTHAFFAKLLEGHSLDHTDRTQGRFRSYLLGAVKHFLADQRDRDRAEKRGGGTQPAPLANMTSDDELRSEGHEPVDHQGFPPDAYFDRQWGLAIVQQAMTTLRAEAIEAGDLARFGRLQPWLVTPSGHETALAAARSLNLTDGAFKVAVHRLRKRYRQLVLERIAATVGDPSEAAEELNYLVTVLARN
jgi:DNA-directed RNA polymerase specialized sigma24 family protein